MTALSWQPPTRIVTKSWRKWIGYFGLLLLALLWGTMVPTVAHLLQRWDPYFLAAFRYIGALPFMWVALSLLERRQPHDSAAVSVDGGDWRIWPLGIIGIGCYATLYTIGVYHCNPITAAILERHLAGHRRRRRPDRVQGAGRSAHAAGHCACHHRQCPGDRAFRRAATCSISVAVRS